MYHHSVTRFIHNSVPVSVWVPVCCVRERGRERDRGRKRERDRESDPPRTGDVWKETECSGEQGRTWTCFSRYEFFLYYTWTHTGVFPSVCMFVCLCVCVFARAGRKASLADPTLSCSWMGCQSASVCVPAVGWLIPVLLCCCLIYSWGFFKAKKIT